MNGLETRSVAVIIPFYKRQHTFEETLKSVLAQTKKPSEIIVVDDASGDNALEYLDQFSEHIRVLPMNENVGVSRARNAGVKAASSQLIAFIDSDDLWQPDKLEKQLEYLEKNPDCNAVHTGTVNFYLNGVEKEYVNKPVRLTKEDLVESSHVMMQSLLMRRNDFIELDGFDPSFRVTEDYEFAMRMVANGFNVDFIPEPLVRIRHGHSDKLSLSSSGFIRGHVGVVWKHARVFRDVDGFWGPYKHTMKYFILGGYHRGGILGRLIRYIGFVFYPTFRVQKSNKH